MSTIRGYTCCGVAMAVVKTARPSRHLVVRYRLCFVCGARVVTEERIAGHRKPRRK